MAQQDLDKDTSGNLLEGEQIDSLQILSIHD